MVSSTSPILEPVNVERSSPQPQAINLEPEQQQMLELENKELVSQFESSMNQIKQIERSLVDISQMQSTLSTHLAIQSKETEKLYSDAVNSTDSMSAANQYLVRAKENSASASKFMFVFLIMASLVLLFLDWYDNKGPLIKLNFLF
jgi:syntaxin 18